MCILHEHIGLLGSAQTVSLSCRLLEAVDQGLSTVYLMSGAHSIACVAGEVGKRAQHLAETGNPAPVLPFGITLIGPAWSDEALWEIAGAFHADTGLGCGPEGHGVQPYRHKQMPV